MKLSQIVAVLIAAAPSVLAGVIQQTDNGAPTVVKMPSTMPGRDRVKIRYGPWTFQGSGDGVETYRLHKRRAAISAPIKEATKPCTDCILTHIAVDLENEQGGSVNIDKGMWLHHVAMFNAGPGRWDATCKDVENSMPHAALEMDPSQSERFFATGNERAAFDPTVNGTMKSGYYLKSTDNWGILFEIENQGVKDQDIYLTFDYEFIKSKPDGWTDVKPVWLDVANCGTSQVEVPDSDNVFKIWSDPWEANFEGKIISLDGHLHDGGLHQEIKWNDQIVCDSVANYDLSGKPVTAEQKTANSTAMPSMHIGSMSSCVLNREMKVGDKFEIKGYYDLNKRPGMDHSDGSKEAVMVLSLFYVQVPTGKF